MAIIRIDRMKHTTREAAEGSVLIGYWMEWAASHGYTARIARFHYYNLPAQGINESYDDPDAHAPGERYWELEIDAPGHNHPSTAGWEHICRLVPIDGDRLRCERAPTHPSRIGGAAAIDALYAYTAEEMERRQKQEIEAFNAAMAALPDLVRGKSIRLGTAMIGDLRELGAHGAALVDGLRTRRITHDDLADRIRQAQGW